MKHVLQGMGDLLSRYAASFRTAWAMRRRLEPPARTSDELEFLPAHLELTDTPVSPAARWTIRTLIAFFCAALLWACVGQLDIVAVASGKAVVSSRTKVVQPLEAARVRAIHVRDGQSVAAGELLIELDSVETGADATQAREALAEARSRAARHAALLAALDAGVPVAEFGIESASTAEIQAANRLARSEYEGFRARREGLASELAQRRAELSTLRELIVHLERTSEVTTRRAADLQALLAKHHIARHEHLAAEQTRIEADRDLAQHRHRVAELQAAIEAKQEERLGLEAEFRRQGEEGLHQARADIARFEPQAGRTAHRDQGMRLTAPWQGQCSNSPSTPSAAS